MFGFYGEKEGATWTPVHAPVAKEEPDTSFVYVVLWSCDSELVVFHGSHRKQWQKENNDEFFTQLQDRQFEGEESHVLELKQGGW